MDNIEGLLKKYWWVLAIGGLGVLGVIYFESKSSSGSSSQTIVPSSGSTGAGSSGTSTDLGSILSSLSADITSNTKSIAALGKYTSTADAGMAKAIAALGSSKSAGGKSHSAGSGSSQTAASTAASIFASGTTNAQVNEITTAEGMSALEGQAYNPNKTSNGGASASYRAAYDAAIAAGTTPPPMNGNYVGPTLPSQNSKGQFVYQ